MSMRSFVLFPLLGLLGACASTGGSRIMAPGSDQATSVDAVAAAIVVVSARAGAQTQYLPDLAHAGPAIGSGLAARSDLREGAVALADLLVDLAVRDAFADTNDHGAGELVLKIVFSS